MSRSKAQLQATDIRTRPYRSGDEGQIVNLLNTCFGDWGTLEKWRFLYSEYPTFTESDIVILEADGKIIAHGGIHFRNLVVKQHALRTATLSDAAIHPRQRGKGLYTKLVKARLREANSKGACLALTWHLRGSNAYEHNRKTGFVEIRQSPVYMKIIRPEKVLIAGLFDLLHKNQRLRWALEDIKVDLCLRVGEVEFGIADLLSKNKARVKKGKTKMQIVFAKDSLLIMANFRNMSKFEKMRNLVLLILLRRIKVKFGSFKGFLSLVCESGKIVRFM